MYGESGGSQRLQINLFTKIYLLFHFVLKTSAADESASVFIRNVGNVAFQFLEVITEVYTYFSDAHSGSIFKLVL